uniref:Uncharacterized protein n=1 Tax=Trametes cingulata TaxID=575983 RepID=D3YNL9_9APHY|nr:hypothetical protein TrcifM_p07 [Trametes cingulata]ADD21055.1 hypothetical protein [Trametes cingulata]
MPINTNISIIDSLNSTTPTVTDSSIIVYGYGAIAFLIVVFGGLLIYQSRIAPRIDTIESTPSFVRNNIESIPLENLQSPQNSQVPGISDQSISSPQNGNSPDTIIPQCPFEENISLFNLFSIPNIKLIIIIIFFLTLIFLIYKYYRKNGLKIVFPLQYFNEINLFLSLYGKIILILIKLSP